MNAVHRSTILVLSLHLLAVACDGGEPADSARAARTAGPVDVDDRADVVDVDDRADVAEAEAAVAVIREYYEAIASSRYADAWRLWSGGGEASGQSLEAFTRGFARTATVRVEPGMPGRIEGAAGSRYVEIPVVVVAQTTAGEPQRFEGSYTLRRSVVDGATEEQRAWRIYSARLVER